MSAGKKKIPQAELRRLMSQHKISKPSLKKVHSAVAKYTEGGQLTCKICSMVVSESLWDLHKKSKQHLENSQRLRTDTLPMPTSNNAHSFKKPISIPTLKPLQIKGILKNAPKVEISSSVTSVKVKATEERLAPSGTKRPAEGDIGSPAKVLRTKSELPDNFFDDAAVSANTTDVEMEEVSEEVDGKNMNIPEGFFDDPMLDAKARNIEYKNPVEEEWEKFQKEIKEETSVSAQIIAEDQDEATVERQIDEIDEQMRNWSRVVDMERKKERIQQEGCMKMEEADENNSSEGEDEFVEYVDWRLKKAYK